MASQHGARLRQKKMADALLDVLRHDALVKRIQSIGGNRVMWSTKDTARIRDYVMAMPAETILRDAPTASRKLVDTGAAGVRRNLSERGIVTRDAHPADRKFLFIVSSEDVDLAGDVVSVDGIDCANFLKNPAVLNGHDSSVLPIASSTSPVVSGRVLTAIAKFPRAGVAEKSDQVAAAIRASLVKGASIGFIPLKWSFSKSPDRPFGVDFQKIRLLEWSICSVPCNPACLLLGAVDGKTALSRNLPIDDAPDEKMAGRLREARALAAQGRSISASISDDPAQTRDQRVAESAKFRRAANAIVS
jgi:hypothetical protein